MKKTFSIIFLFISAFVVAQEALYDLDYNKALFGYHKEFKAIKNQKAGNDTLSVPFMEDFTKYYYFPDPAKWNDINVYVNASMAKNPHSYGVATFDGLDSTGYPYNFTNPVAKGVADYMTSKPFFLSGLSDSVYMSFWYQPQGLGNQPESEDSLTLEFYNPSTNKWHWKWSVKGAPVHDFKQVMLFVDTMFQKDGFKFRFKNYATLCGNVDHWHVDYIYLNQGRTKGDTKQKDVTHKYRDYSFLKDYKAMPWWHYKADSINNMIDFLRTKVYNYDNSAGYAINYKYKVYDSTGVLIEEQPVFGQDPFFTVAPNDSVNVINEVYKPTPAGPTANDFYFPTNNRKTYRFMIQNYFTLDKTSSQKFDFHTKNDTFITYQVFGDYYSRDDGTAEVAWGLQGIGAQAAYRFSSKIQDTLTGMYIYWSPLRDNMSSASLKLTVWSNDLNTPIYQEPVVVSPIYTFLGEFVEYRFSSPVIISGSFYIGYEKITAAPMNVGFDYNNDNSANIYYNATGTWANTSFKGSLLMRPKFRNGINPSVNIKEESIQEINFTVYPNPANSTLNINGVVSPNKKIAITDLSGKRILETDFSNQIDVSNLQNGIYLITVFGDKSAATTKKFIIAR